MYRFERTRFRLRPLPWWKVALIAAVAAAIVIAIAVVAFSLVLILVPLVLLAVLIHRLTASRRRPDMTAPRDTRIIDADYEVIEIDDRRRDR